MIAIDKMYVKVVGVSPLILQNGRCANPLDPFAKKMKSLTSKKNKTEDDLHAILETQWEAGLYFDPEIGLYMPSENLYAGFYSAAKKHKLGNKCSAVLFPEALGYPIVTENHQNLSKLRDDQRTRFIKTVVVQRAKTVACRPIFNSWKIDFDLEFERDTWDANEIKTVLQTFSSRIGMGVWRPSSPKPGSYGKFIIESMIWEDSKNKTRKEIKGL